MQPANYQPVSNNQPYPSDNNVTLPNVAYKPEIPPQGEQSQQPQPYTQYPQPYPAQGLPMNPSWNGPQQYPQYPPQQGMPPQGMPQQGMPPQGMPQQGMPQQGMPQQGMPPQGMPQQGMCAQGMSPQGMNQQIWMQRPPQVMGCPPGLEYLTMVDQILVHQQIELLEVFTNWETKNKYQIKNSVGQQVYYAAEESDVCARQCCGPQRGFVMHITDNMGTEVIRAMREFKCCAGPCCHCCAGLDMCAQELVVEAPPGQTIGRVIQKASCLEPSYAIQNERLETMLQIRGPICICQGPCCTWDQEFKVYSADMSAELGRISKQWSGFVHEYFTDADNFGVSFPIDLDVKMKATMLAAVFLIDFMFFENNQQNQNN